MACKVFAALCHGNTMQAYNDQSQPSRGYVCLLGFILCRLFKDTRSDRYIAPHWIKTYKEIYLLPSLR